MPPVPLLWLLEMGRTLQTQQYPGNYLFCPAPTSLPPPRPPSGAWDASLALGWKMTVFVRAPPWMQARTSAQACQGPWVGHTWRKSMGRGTCAQCSGSCWPLRPLGEPCPEEEKDSALPELSLFHPPSPQVTSMAQQKPCRHIRMGKPPELFSWSWWSKSCPNKL